MPKFHIKAETRADIWERWEIEATDAAHARYLFEECPDGQIADLIEQGVDGGEGDREIVAVDPVVLTGGPASGFHMLPIVDDQELGTMLAALRYWQRRVLTEGHNDHLDEADVATCGDQLDPLTATGVDALCEKLNSDAVSPHSVTILWGEIPEEGDKAVTYRFATKGEHDAFMQGVEEMDGWAGWREMPEGYVVPPEGFNDLDEADDEAEA